MQLYILNEQYDVIGMIDSYESVLWLKKYNGIGECEIYVICDADMLSLLLKNHYVYRFDDDMFCKIEDRRITTSAERGDHIIATATDLLNILSSRIIKKRITYSGTVVGFIERAVTENVLNDRAIPNLRIDKNNFAELTATMEADMFGDNLLDAILTACKSSNYGVKITFDINAKEYILRIYQGKNKASSQSAEYVEFSPQFENIISSDYRESDSNYKNVAWVSYLELDEKERTYEVFEGTRPQGELRKEIFVDGTNTKRERTLEELQEMFPDVSEVGADYIAKMNGASTTVARAITVEEDTKIILTDVVFFGLLRKLGTDALLQHQKTQGYSGAVDTLVSYRYKADYDVGDVVKVKNEYGIEAEAQITEVMESDDNDNGYAVEPHFEYFN